MTVYHPWSGIPHYYFNFFPHQELIAMNTAFRTCRLVYTEAALVEFLVGIIDKFPAVTTGGSAGVMFAAIQ
jgi:hypothetical protein